MSIYENKSESLIRSYFTIKIEDDNDNKNEDIMSKFECSVTKLKIQYSLKEIDFKFTEFESCTQINYFLYFKNRNINIIINFYKPDNIETPIKSYKLNSCKISEKNIFVSDLTICDVNNNLVFDYYDIKEII